MRRPERWAALMVGFGLTLAAGWGTPPSSGHDEQRVRGSIPWRALAQGEVRGAAFNALHMTYARPGLFVAFAPAGLASWAFGPARPPVDPDHTWFLDASDWRWALGMNAVWAALLVGWGGTLAERLGGRGAGACAAWWLALSVVVLHQARTLFPSVAAAALIAAFFLAYLRARERPSDERAAAAGGVLFAALSVYPGAYPLALILPIDFVRGGAQGRRRAGVALLALVLGLLVTEAVCKLSYGGSYLFELRDLSEGVLAGDTREGWSYPWDYLAWLDGPLGALGLAAAITAPRWARTPEQRLLGWTALGVYVWCGLVASTLLGRQALYGRQVAVWLALVFPLAVCAPRIGRRRALAAIVLLGLHQAPGLWRLFTTPRERHPGALYEGLGPSERAAARSASR